ncbi:MAG: ribonuclease P protein component [Candidatus Niyogibacteria bacterium]|nr:ribonuclease P protein component [Candidatus Niyogibacteria bacterium]
MLPKSRKISGRKNFEVIYRSGQRTFSHFIHLFFVPSKGPGRFACVISLKVSKRAILRNKLRRRAYSIIRENLFNIKDGYAVILVFKSGAAELSRAQLLKNILDLFKMSGLASAPIVQ